MSYYEISIETIIFSCSLVERNSLTLRLFVSASLSSSALAVAWNKRNKQPYGQHDPISCEKGLDLALTRKLADRIYYAYFPFGAMIERTQMRPYHKKFLVRRG